MPILGWCVPTQPPSHWDKMSVAEAKKREKKFIKDMAALKKERDEELSEKELGE